MMNVIKKMVYSTEEEPIEWIILEFEKDYRK